MTNQANPVLKTDADSLTFRDRVSVKVVHLGSQKAKAQKLWLVCEPTSFFPFCAEDSAGFKTAMCKTAQELRTVLERQVADACIGTGHYELHVTRGFMNAMIATR